MTLIKPNPLEFIWRGWGRGEREEEEEERGREGRNEISLYKLGNEIKFKL